MKLNKEEFLKTEFGSELECTIIAWDEALERNGRIGADKDILKTLSWCQAQWEVYRMAIKHFYGVEYHFTRTDEYYGLCTENERDFLFKKKRHAVVRDDMVKDMKSTREWMKGNQKVTRRGVKVEGKWFWDDTLVLKHLGETVNVTIIEKEVFIKTLSGELIATFDKSIGE